MKEQREPIWKFIFDRTKEIIKRDGLPESEFQSISFEIFSTFMDFLYSDSGLGRIEGASFTTAFQKCNLTRADIADVLNKECPSKRKDKLDGDDVKDGLVRARRKIKEHLKEKSGVMI